MMKEKPDHQIAALSEIRDEQPKSRPLDVKELEGVTGGVSTARQTPKTDFGDRMKAGTD
jgi:hypothetical protein